MRTIKFRAKTSSDGRWVYGDLLHRFGIHEIYRSRGTSQVLPETVGQYTGLKDKNEVEIYEGDIVIEKSYPMYDNSLCNYRCVVVWDEEEAGFGLEMYVVSNRVRGCAVPDSISGYTELEVIGNIHDNPELIGL